MILKLITALIYICIFFISSQINAEVVKLTNASGNTIAADYLPGTNTKSPILVLHGFLQTNKFPTVSRLVTELHESGYTILSPTLSLGINNRKQSLSCEAIHTNSMDSDAAEIAQWTEWLHLKTAKQVNLIGHSSGGLVLLKYMEVNKAKYVDHTFLISLPHSDTEINAGHDKVYLEKALKAISSGTNPLDDYALNYCESYPTYASAYMSYYVWDMDKTIDVIREFNEQISIIIGSNDKRIDNKWRQQLQSKHNNVIFIEGASHFFDQTHEFDLIEAIENLLIINKKS